MLRFDFGARSDTGLVRHNNEDAGFAGPYLLLVADGVGGAAAGEVASATAAYVVAAMARAHLFRHPAALLAAAVAEAHHQLQLGVADHAERDGMATTLTAVLLEGGHAAIAHLGDSRAYLLRDGELTRLTSDHTLVQAMVDEGRITPEQAREHPYRSVVVRSLNHELAQPPDLGEIDLLVGDRLLLCSDGLTDYVDEPEVATLLGAGPDVLAVATALVDAALAAESRDNVTCLVADVVDGPEVVGDGVILGALADPGLVVDPAAVRRRG
ncbi:PP2C family protein-serine/threonine phosphatase [Nocardioides sp.]|uniref:PP2C family protein-serine/threonine phosphatase n=1 Tax=Nocardioides sp. TaxID=35761 RepID=UPI0039E43EC9